MTFTAKDTKALSKKPHKKDREELALIIMHHHDWCEKKYGIPINSIMG